MNVATLKPMKIVTILVVTDEDTTSVSSLGGSITPLPERPDHFDGAGMHMSSPISTRNRINSNTSSHQKANAPW